MRKRILGLLVLGVFISGCHRKAPPAPTEVVKGDWEKVLRVSQTTATLQVVVSPLMRRGSSVHDRIFQNLRELQCDGVRYDPWLPYPKLAVPEIQAPEPGKTFWDFSLIDPVMEDFVSATEGHPVIVNFSVIPQWMFKTPKPIPYPADPDQITWNYQQGTEFRDPSLKEVADYYARLVGWYTQGGFTDECGKRHDSGHHYKIDYWEILNEIDLEHQMTPQTYTQVYDAIAGAIHKVDRNIKFVGLALSITSRPDYFEYFLNHQTHKRDIPLDMISYHFYAAQEPGQDISTMQYTFFDQADTFLAKVRYIEDIRERLSPQTGTTVDEMGALLNDEFHQGEPGHVAKPIPPAFWNLSAALFAYVYGNLSQLGINALAESALAQLPGFFPSVTMVDWNTGQPNARYWVLKLIRENLGPGDTLVETSAQAPPEINPQVYAQAFVASDGRRKVLLVNKRNTPFQVSVPGSSGGEVQVVDETTASRPPTTAQVKGDTLTLNAFGVAVLTLPGGGTRQ